MATDEHLDKVILNDWVELRDLYRREWPRYEVVYNTVQNFIDWAQQLQALPDVTFYCLRGNGWRKDGTVLITSKEYLYIYTLDESLGSLRRLMLAFHWDRCFLIAMTRYRALVQDVYQTLRMQKQLDVPNFFYHLPREQAIRLSVDLPEGFATGRIGPEHATTIDDHWQHRGPGSRAMIELLLRRNLSMGLYDMRTGVRRLVGWCIRGENGALSILGVEEKRKGYGTLLIKSFAKLLAEQGKNAYACIVTDNVASRALFLKLGFAELYPVDYFQNSVRMD